jgi:anti-anti-sigma factor
MRPVQTLDISPLRLEFERTAGHPLHVIASGEIDFSCASSMQARIIAAREREATSELILDLAAVGFIDSSGMGVLLRLQRELQSEGGGLVLLCPTAQVRRTMAAMGLDEHLAVVDDHIQAEAQLAEQRP